MPSTGRPLVERLGVSDAWTINTYDACEFRCDYCITATQGVSTPRRSPDRLVADLHRELDAIETIDNLIIGAFADAYPTVEERHRVTRRALEVVQERGLRCNVITKGPLVARDIDVLASVAVQVSISLSTLDEEYVRVHEPGAPTAEARLALLDTLVGAGLPTGLKIAPWIPGVSDVAAIADRAPSAVDITVTPLRLPDGLSRAHRAYGDDQQAVNESFRREYERVGDRDNVRWSRPPPLDGSPLHIRHQMGRRSPDDFSPAPAASGSVREIR